MVTEESIKQFSVQCSRIFEETGMLQEKLPGLKRHLKAFPQMTSKSFQESIQKLRNRL